MNDFVPERVYFEPGILGYPLGRELLARYRQRGVPLIEIESHNRIPELRARPESDFAKMKRYLVLGVRKSLSHTPNAKTSDFLVPYTSAGCAAMCLYCYLVCTFFTGSYLRVFVNREDMMEKMKRKAEKDRRDYVFEIGSNSDLVLENTVTGNLEWTVRQFADAPFGRLTLPTKFHMIDPLLSLDHRGRTTVRMSLNPSGVIRSAEWGTSSLPDRMDALIRLWKAGYPVGILIAPVILTDGWRERYRELFETMAGKLPAPLLQDAPLEIIFMTSGRAHRTLNAAAFPGAVQLYSEKKMSPGGWGKYRYTREEREPAEEYIRRCAAEILPRSTIAYVC